jgi:hypothetical protein
MHSGWLGYNLILNMVESGGERMSTRTALANEQFIVDAKGKRTAVLLPLKRYQELLEDLHDLAVVAERRAEEPIALDQVQRRLREDGHHRTISSRA